jgi:hypothetical protein
LLGVTDTIRWTVVTVLVGHALLHLLGTVKGFHWAEVPQLTQPIGAAAGVVWLLAAILALASAALLAVGAPNWWWAAALSAAAVSQVAVVTSWNDAKAGTVINLLVALAAAYWFAAAGPASFQAQWHDQANRALADAEASPSLLAEADLVDLPRPLAAYLRRSGAVGKPRVTSVLAGFHGRIRSSADEGVDAVHR